MDSSPERPVGHDTGRDDDPGGTDAAAAGTPAPTPEAAPAPDAPPTEAPPTEAPAGGPETTQTSDPDSSIVASVEVPAGEGPSSQASPGGGEPEEGGEWQQLLEALREWWQRADIPTRLSQARRPAQLLASAALLLLALRLYAAIVHLIDSVPVVSGLLELTGLVVAVRFGATRLVRRSDREQVLQQLRTRWQAFRGRD
jgi:hypothetical protein